VSVWLWSSRCFSNPYIFEKARNLTFFHFKFLWNLRGRKDGIFMVRPRRHLASLRHWVSVLQIWSIQVQEKLRGFITLFFCCRIGFSWLQKNSKTFANIQASSSVIPLVLPEFAKFGQAITGQPIALESCSNPQKLQKVLQFRLKKWLERFRFKLSCVLPHNRWMFRLFWPKSSDPALQPQVIMLYDWQVMT